MSDEVEFDVTQADLQWSSRDVAMRSREHSAWTQWLTALLVLSIALPIFPNLLARQPLTVAHFAAAGVATYFALRLKSSWWRNWRRQVDEHSKKQDFQPQFSRMKVTISFSGIRAAAPAWNCEYSWQCVREIVPSNDGIVFTLSNDSGILVPVRAFPDPQDMERFMEKAQSLRNSTLTKRCFQCGYDLTGATRPGCPECGLGREGAHPGAGAE